MSASTFKILKQCIACGNMFEAQKVTTKYCSHRCNSKHYKLRKKIERKENAELPLTIESNFKPKLNAVNKYAIKDKEYLTVREVAYLFNCTPKTIYAIIKAGKLKATNLGVRLTYIKRSNIEKLFE
jgi:excisionase family DNA binding protein